MEENKKLEPKASLSVEDLKQSLDVFLRVFNNPMNEDEIIVETNFEEENSAEAFIKVFRKKEVVADFMVKDSYQGDVSKEEIEKRLYLGVFRYLGKLIVKGSEQQIQEFKKLMEKA
jgi:hypothetical protein